MSGVIIDGEQFEKCSCSRYVAIEHLHQFITKEGAWVTFCGGCVEKRIIPIYDDLVESLTTDHVEPFKALFVIEE